VRLVDTTQVTSERYKGHSVSGNGWFGAYLNLIADGYSGLTSVTWLITDCELRCSVVMTGGRCLMTGRDPVRFFGLI
jgi:hypothetical protein